MSVGWVGFNEAVIEGQTIKTKMYNVAAMITKDLKNQRLDISPSSCLEIFVMNVELIEG